MDGNRINQNAGVSGATPKDKSPVLKAADNADKSVKAYNEKAVIDAKIQSDAKKSKLVNASNVGSNDSKAAQDATKVYNAYIASSERKPEIKDIRTTGTESTTSATKSSPPNELTIVKGNLTENIDVQPGTKEVKQNIPETLLEMQTTTTDIKKEEILDVKYDFDKATLRSDQDTTDVLDKLVKYLTDNPDVKIEINAHTDREGSIEHNQTLSDGRAKRVKDYLVSKGIDAERLSTKGWSKTKPVIVDSKLASKYSFLKKGDVLSESFIDTIPDDQKAICNQINRRTAYSEVGTKGPITTEEITGEKRPTSIEFKLNSNEVEKTTSFTGGGGLPVTYIDKEGVVKVVEDNKKNVKITVSAVKIDDETVKRDGGIIFHESTNTFEIIPNDEGKVKTISPDGRSVKYYAIGELKDLIQKAYLPGRHNKANILDTLLKIRNITLDQSGTTGESATMEGRTKLEEETEDGLKTLKTIVNEGTTFTIFGGKVNTLGNLSPNNISDMTKILFVQKQGEKIGGKNNPDIVIAKVTTDCFPDTFNGQKVTGSDRKIILEALNVSDCINKDDNITLSSDGTYNVLTGKFDDLGSRENRAGGFFSSSQRHPQNKGHVKNEWNQKLAKQVLKNAIFLAYSKEEKQGNITPEVILTGLKPDGSTAGPLADGENIDALGNDIALAKKYFDAAAGGTEVVTGEQIKGRINLLETDINSLEKKNLLEKDVNLKADNYFKIAGLKNEIAKLTEVRGYIEKAEKDSGLESNEKTEIAINKTQFINALVSGVYIDFTDAGYNLGRLPIDKVQEGIELKNTYTAIPITIEIPSHNAEASANAHLKNLDAQYGIKKSDEIKLKGPFTPLEGDSGGRAGVREFKYLENKKSNGSYYIGSNSFFNSIGVLKQILATKADIVELNTDYKNVAFELEGEGAVTIPVVKVVK